MNRPKRSKRNDIPLEYVFHGRAPFIGQSTELIEFAKQSLDDAEDEYFGSVEDRRGNIDHIPRSPFDFLLEDTFIEIISMLESEEGTEQAINMIKNHFKVDV
jgi:hypothetical protein